MAVEERLAELGLDLPPPMHLSGQSGQRFELVRITGDQVTIAGHLPIGPDGSIAGPMGKVGAEVSADEAHQSARLIALDLLRAPDVYTWVAFLTPMGECAAFSNAWRQRRA